MPSPVPSADNAPPALHRIVEFVNTRRADGDHLTTPAHLLTWLNTHDLRQPAPDPTDVLVAPGTPNAADAGGLQRALSLREGLRALLAGNNAAPVPSPRPDGLDPQAFQKCRTLTDMLPLVLDITGPQPRLVPHTDDPVDFALATMLADVFAAVSAGTWNRMKACREPSCRWAFYDHSRNRGRTWCSMNVCGNRVKVRASHRRRTLS
ncbi:CGNR zinc finger domain-containing protein [Nocardia brasiliensis]|uniref:CGNR zinc finger domain-containing protein n=1 Tax=Nocardia brasiliensis TaxID=37326 RepID=UPI0004A72DF3|nr:CGNR zinc finger domain-containing protein [Nocardia brasiliensis]